MSWRTIYWCVWAIRRLLFLKIEFFYRNWKIKWNGIKHANIDLKWTNLSFVSDSTQCEFSIILKEKNKNPLSFYPIKADWLAGWTPFFLISCTRHLSRFQHSKMVDSRHFSLQLLLFKVATNNNKLMII